MATSKKRGVSIFLRILFFFMLVNIATSSILIFLAYSFSRDSIERRTKENIAQQIDTIHQIFAEQFITELKRSLSTIAASSALDDYLQASVVERIVAQKKLERMFLQLLRDFGDFHSASFVNADGDVMIEAVGKVRRREPINLETGRSESAGITDPAAFEASARLFKLLKSIPLLLSSGGMEWFMPPREMEISGPFVDQNGRVSFVAGLAKIDLDTGSFGGVVVIRHKLDDFLAGLRTVTFLEENPIWVFDGKGRALQRPENDEATFDPSEYLTGAFQGNLEFARLDRGIVAFQDFAIAPGRPFLRVAVAIPSALLLKDFSPAIRFFSAVLVISLVVVFAVALYVSRYLSNPIVALAAAAARLAGGNLEARVKVRTTGEVQILVDSFNRMTERLRETIASRDESVRSLEAEVAVRKRAEEQLKRQAEEITRARIAAEDASRAKSSFLAKMSHEVRTPMIGVLGMTDLLGRTGLGNRQTRLVGTLRQSAESLLHIINDILDFSRIEAGKFTLDRIEFELRNLVADVVELLAEPAQSKQLEVVYSVAPDVPDWLSGDPHRLRQILTNLIGNATKFTERGEIEIRVKLGRQTADTVSLDFQVKDTGIGIDPADQANLFESFEQANETISRKYGGTGLGLSITKQLVTMMGGRIGVESAPGRGSRFWFTAAFGRCHRQATGRAAGSELAGARVLVVDDNATNREVLCQYLSAEGAACREVESGAEALAQLRAAAGRGEGFDSAVLDMAMPEMNGVELARTIKASPEISDTQLILLTSIGWEEDSALAKAAGFCAYLTKPVRQNDLCRQVMRILNLPGSCAPAAPQLPAENPPAASPAPSVLEARVLLAEDNPVNQEVAREYLEDLGCRVEIVETGAAAVEAFGRTDCDLILMDCQMPEMDGFEATWLIREEERRAGAREHMTIIAVTAYTTPGERQRCLDAGMDDYLAKPFDQEELRVMLRRWLPDAAMLGAGPRDATPQEATPQEAAQEAGEAVLDQSALDKIRAVDRKTGRGVLSKVVGIYLDHTPAELRALGAAVARKDAAAVAKLAHGLKSSSANLGAQTLAGLLKELEHRGRGEVLAEAPALFARIEAEFERVRPALEAELPAAAPLSESA